MNNPTTRKHSQAAAHRGVGAAAHGDVGLTSVLHGRSSHASAPDVIGAPPELLHMPRVVRLIGVSLESRCYYHFRGHHRSGPPPHGTSHVDGSRGWHVPPFAGSPPSRHGPGCPVPGRFKKNAQAGLPTGIGVNSKCRTPKDGFRATTGSVHVCSNMKE